MPPVPIQPELLLAHADFVRSLAAALLADPHAGEDVAQETFIAALVRPPRHAGRLAGWLARTVHSLASNARRSEQRRRLREADVPPAEPAPSPADVLAREQVRRQVVDAVLALEPPYRDAVLLRYWEGLAPAAIARRLGVPGATVRSRLMRGLHHLRTRLEADGRDRADWRAVLAPLAAVDGLLPVVLVMKKIAFPVSLALLTALLAVAWWPAAGASPPAGEALPAHVVADAERKASVPEPERTATPEPDRQPAASTPPPAAAVYPADRPPGHLHGQVVDELRRPIEGALVTLHPLMGNLPAGEDLRDDRTGDWQQTAGAGGAFAFSAIPCGAWVVRARHEGAAGSAAVVVGAGQDEGPVDLVLGERQPTAGDQVVVHVVHPDGTPAAGAEVEAYVHSATSGLLDGKAKPPLTGTTDTDGNFVIRGRRLVAGVFLARHEERPGMGSARFTQPSPTVRVELAPAGALHGRLTGTSAEQLVGTRVRVHALSSTHPYYSGVGRTCEADLVGSEFRFDGLPAGEYGVTLHSPRGWRLDLPPFHWGDTPLPNSVAMQTADIRAGETTNVALSVTAGGVLEGSVRRATDGDAQAGRPVDGARVLAVLAPPTSNFPAGFVLHGAHVWRLDGPYERGGHNPQTHVETTTDADGRYVLPGLHPGQYRVEVLAPGLSLDRRLDVAVRDGATTVLEHALERAGVLQIGATDTGYLGVVPAGGTRPRMLAIGAHGVITFPGLAAGRYTVTRFHSDTAVAPRPLVEAVVEAGRTTWVDLRTRDVQAVVTGVVRGANGPLGGVWVRVHPQRTRTAADGTFELRLHYRPRSTHAFGTNIQLTADGLEHRIPWPETASGSAAPHLELRLGAHELGVQVLDAQGRPSRATVQVEGGGVSGRIAATESGEATARHLEPGTYRVRAFLPDGSEPEATVEVPAAAPLVLRALPGGLLRVLVTRGGVPRAGVSVAAYTWTGEGEPPAARNDFAQHAISRHATSGADGVAEFPGLAAGHVRVFVSGGFMAPTREQQARVAPGGTTEIAIDMQ